MNRLNQLQTNALDNFNKLFPKSLDENININKEEPRVEEIEMDEETTLMENYSRKKI